MASKEIQELIKGRADALTDAYHSANVDTMMDWYSKDVNFSDHGTSSYLFICPLSNVLTNTASNAGHEP